MVSSMKLINEKLAKLTTENESLLREIHELKEYNRRLKEHNKRLHTKAGNNLKMMAAYYYMLGPVAKKIADIWYRKGVKAFHASWNWEDGASNLTGEERAQILLDVEEGISSGKFKTVEFIDSFPPTLGREAKTLEDFINERNN